MNIFITIVILIVMLGILLATHELGHLLLAKGFNVFCLEYSIGFGPKLFSWRKKGGETFYSLRAVPLGGYVSMYADGVELEEGQTVPKSRSIEGISAGKRALVMMGGIAMNLLFSLIFTFIYALAFPSSYQSQALYLESPYSSSVLTSYALWGEGEIDGEIISPSSHRIYSPEIVTDNNLNQIGFLLDSDIVFVDQDTKEPLSDEVYAAVYIPSSLEGADLLSSLVFYPVSSSLIVSDEDTYLGIDGHADVSQLTYHFLGNEEFELDLTLISVLDANTAPSEEAILEGIQQPRSVTIRATGEADEITLSGLSMTLTPLEEYAPIGDRFLMGCEYFANFFVAIGQGLGALFTFDFSQLGSVVAMGSMLSQSSAAIGWGRTFFFYGGYLALNLAIFNLLPIPGLDGWQLLVTGVEKVFKRQIPDKVKNIVSYVGLGLLLILGVGIIIKDVIGLF